MAAGSFPLSLQGNAACKKLRWGIECLEDLTLLTASLEKVQKLLETNLVLNIVVRRLTLLKGG